MTSSSKQSDPLLNEKIAAIRERNTKLENRYREVELDKKSAVESGSSILPSQIKVTIFQKGSRGRSHAFNNSDHPSQDFNDFCQRTQRSYRGRGGVLTNNFSKSMSRLSQDAPSYEDSSQAHQTRHSDRYVNTNGAPYAPRGGGRRPQQQQQQSMDDRRRGSGRFIRPPVPPGVYSSGRKVRIEEDVPGLPPASRAWNNQAPSTVRKGPPYGNRGNPGPPRYRDLREFLNSARSMPALDDVDSYGDPRCNRHPPSPSFPSTSHYPQRRQRNNSNYQNAHFNDAPAGDSYGPRDSYAAKRSFPQPPAPGRHQNWRSSREENANAQQQQQRRRSSSRRRQAAAVEGGGGQPRTSSGSEASAGHYAGAWPPAALPCDASGKWVRGMVRCGKHEIAVETACETEGNNQVHVCASCGCAKVGTAAPGDVKTDADGLDNDEDDGRGSIESIHCASNDEYIDDNPLDDLDQFTLKIDMDGGFVVHDASICDPILQKPIGSWIDEELADLCLDTGPTDEPETGAAADAVAVQQQQQPSEEPTGNLSSSLPLSVECSIFSAAPSSSSGVSTLSSRLSVGCVDVPSVEPPLRRVVSAEQVDKISLNRTIGPNLWIR